ncbi:MAG: alpha/beta hydrolase [Actinomycetota bacterium]
MSDDERREPVRSRAVFDELGNPLPDFVIEEEQGRRVQFTESGEVIEEEPEEEEPRHEFALYCNIQPSRGEPEGALILFHGRGTDEHDLFQLLEILDPSRRLLGITPRAPIEDDDGHCQWFLSHEVGRPDAETFFSTKTRIENWLGLIAEDTGIPANRFIFGGFSQGAVMAYAMALGAGIPRSPALIALSGFIPEVEGLELDLSNRQGFPVAIAHGVNDTVIPPRWSREARRVLEEAGCDVVYRESRMPHAVDPRFLYELPDMIYRALERVPAAKS